MSPDDNGRENLLKTVDQSSSAKTRCCKWLIHYINLCCQPFTWKSVLIFRIFLLVFCTGISRINLKKKMLLAQQDYWRLFCLTDMELVSFEVWNQNKLHEYGRSTVGCSHIIERNVGRMELKISVFRFWKQLPSLLLHRAPWRNGAMTVMNKHLPHYFSYCMYLVTCSQ